MQDKQEWSCFFCTTDFSAYCRSVVCLINSPWCLSDKLLLKLITFHKWARLRHEKQPFIWFLGYSCCDLFIQVFFAFYLRFKLLESKLESTLKSSLEIKEEKIASLEARLQESSNLNQQLRQELKTVSQTAKHPVSYRHQNKCILTQICNCVDFSGWFHSLPAVKTKILVTISRSDTLFSHLFVNQQKSEQLNGMAIQTLQNVQLDAWTFV